MIFLSVSSTQREKAKGKKQLAATESSKRRLRNILRKPQRNVKN